MNPTDLRNWGGALVASLLLHGMLFLNAGAQVGAEPRTVHPERTVTRVSFSAATRPPVTPPEAPVEKPVEPPPEPPKPPKEPPPKPKPAPKPAPRPEPKPQPAPDPEPAPPAEPVPTVAQAADPPPPPGAATVADPGLVEKARNEYLARLMAHIESFKHYPRAARRRGIEGGVAVRFTLLAGGHVRDIDAGGGHSLLREAAATAVRSAVPMPEPPPAVETPMAIALEMVFALQQ